MLPKENRLKRKKDFEMVFKKGKGFKQNFLFTKVLENNLEETRFGFVVSQKVCKKATIRNKIKRRLREIVRERLEEIRKGIDVILVAMPGLEEKEFKEIKQNVDELFKKAGVVQA